MKTVISIECIIIDSDKEEEVIIIDSDQEDCSTDESIIISSDEAYCSTEEGKIHLFKEYLSCKIIIQSSKPELLLNFKVLSRFTNLLFFNVNFPKEIIAYINNIYIELRRKSIDVDFDLKKFGNICPCDENIHCHERWYEMANDLVGKWIDKTEKSRITLKLKDYNYPNPLELSWHLYHCDVAKDDIDDDDIPEDCHNIFFFRDGKEADGFLCKCCNRYCCSGCGKCSMDYCIECFPNYM